MPPRLVLITPEHCQLEAIEGLLPCAARYVDLLILRWPSLGLRDVCARIERLLKCSPRPPLAAHGRFDLALAYDLQAVQLPESALLPRTVREAAPSLTIGASRHDRAGLGSCRGADYVTLSLFAPSMSKPGVACIDQEEFSNICASSALPILALGGVDERNAAAALAAGASGVAVIRAVFGAADPERSLERLRAVVDRAHRRG